jgi:AcrR family transcriptional regulator
MLIEAGLACLARGGITAFTIDNICAEAGVSRGLVTHHFKSKDGLLVAIYAAIYDRSLAVFTPASGQLPAIEDIIEAEFHPDRFTREHMTLWLALWGEIATTPALAAAHHSYYAKFRDGIAAALGRSADARDRNIDAPELAVLLIALIDGLWLEGCIAPDLMSSERARKGCFRMLEPFLGPLPG